MANTDPIHAFVAQQDPGFHFVTTAEHYDGVYYYAIAADPFARGTAHHLIDLAPYRYGHPLHGWLVGLLSWGDPAWIPLALFIVSLLGLFLAGWSASTLARDLGASGSVGLVAAASPGLLFATTVDTTETLGAGLVLTALLLWQRQRWRMAVVLILLCCSDKEQYVTVPIGLAAWELLRVRCRVNRIDHLRFKVIAVALGPVALGGWYLYVHDRFGRWPFQYQPGNFGAPGTGFGRSFSDARDWSASGSFERAQMGSIVAPVLVATLAIVLAGAVTAVRGCTVIAGPLVGMAAIILGQGHLTLEYPHEIFRTPAVTVLLASVAVLCGRPAALRRQSPRRDVEQGDAESAGGALGGREDPAR